jgi:hypothetical protein
MLATDTEAPLVTKDLHQVDPVIVSTSELSDSRAEMPMYLPASRLLCYLITSEDLKATKTQVAITNRSVAELKLVATLKRTIMDKFPRRLHRLVLANLSALPILASEYGRISLKRSLIFSLALWNERRSVSLL